MLQVDEFFVQIFCRYPLTFPIIGEVTPAIEGIIQMTTMVFSSFTRGLATLAAPKVGAQLSSPHWGELYMHLVWFYSNQNTVNILCVAAVFFVTVFIDHDIHY